MGVKDQNVLDLGQLKVKNGSHEVKPVSYEQVIEAGDDYYIIDAATSQIVKEINEIDPRLHVKYSSRCNFFVLYAKEVREGREEEYLVRTFTHLDNRIVERVKQISHHSYDYAQDMEDGEKELDSKKLHAIKEKLGDNAERLAFALRKDLGVKDYASMHGTGVNKKLMAKGDKFLGGVRGKDG